MTNKGLFLNGNITASYICFNSWMYALHVDSHTLQHVATPPLFQGKAKAKMLVSSNCALCGGLHFSSPQLEAYWCELILHW